MAFNGDFTPGTMLPRTIKKLVIGRAKLGAHIGHQQAGLSNFDVVATVTWVPSELILKAKSGAQPFGIVAPVATILAGFQLRSFLPQSRDLRSSELRVFPGASSPLWAKRMTISPLTHYSPRSFRYLSRRGDIREFTALPGLHLLVHRPFKQIQTDAVRGTLEGFSRG
jgi:hypothetical protein